MANSAHKFKKTSKKQMKKASKKQMKKTSKKSSKKKILKKRSNYILLKGGANKFTDAIEKAKASKSSELFKAAYAPDNLADFLTLNKSGLSEATIEFNNASNSINIIKTKANDRPLFREHMYNLIGQSFVKCNDELQCIIASPGVTEQNKQFYFELVGHVKNIRNVSGARDALITILKHEYPIPK